MSSPQQVRTTIASSSAPFIITASNLRAARGKAKKQPRAKLLSPLSSNCARKKTILSLRASSSPFNSVNLFNSFNALSTFLNQRQKLLVGVIHLRPLPGSPHWQGDLEKVITAAVADAHAY